MSISHRTNRLKLKGIPSVEKLQNGRYKLTVECSTMNSREDWYSANKARIFPDFGSLQSAEMSIDGLEPRTGEAYTDMRLTGVQSGSRSVRDGGDYLVVLTYETLGSSFVQVKDDTFSYTESGLRKVTRKSIAESGTDYQKTIGESSISSQIDDETAVVCKLGSYEVNDTDSYREVTEVYMEPGIISSVEDFEGSQKTLVQETFSQDPVTPTGYSKAREEVSNADGIPTNRYTFLKDDVQLSESEDKVGSQLAITEQWFKPAASRKVKANYSLAKEEANNVDGIPTEGYTFLKDNVKLARSIENKKGNATTGFALIREAIEVFKPASTPNPTTTGAVLIGEDVSDVDGIPTKRFTFAKGDGEIIVDKRPAVSQLGGCTQVTVTTLGSSVPTDPTGIITARTESEDDGYKTFVVTAIQGIVEEIKQEYADVIEVDVPGEVNLTTENVSITDSELGTITGNIAIPKIKPVRRKKIACDVTVEITKTPPDTASLAFDLGDISCSVTSVSLNYSSKLGPTKRYRSGIFTLSKTDYQRSFSPSARVQSYPGCFLTGTTPTLSEGSVEYDSQKFHLMEPDEDEDGLPDGLESTIDSVAENITQCIGEGSTSDTTYLETGVVQRSSRPIFNDLDGNTYYEVITWSVS